MSIEVKNLVKSFGPLDVLSGISHTFPDSTITAVIGPSGCGKTTLLRLLSGLAKPDSGEILGIPLGAVSYVFQEPRLLPWFGARKNLEIALEGKLPTRDSKIRGERFIRLVGLSDFLDSRPGELSGGMRQRLSLARAFALPSPLLLMDEPFQSLDLRSRIDLMDAFLSLWEEEKRTCIFVTHDVQEAIYLGDSIVVLSERPARIISGFHVDIPHGRRSFGSGELEKLETELYSLVLEKNSTVFHSP